MSFRPTDCFPLRATAAAQGKPRAKEEAPGRLGRLPEWNLADLYASPDSPELAADLKTAERAAQAIQDSYAGKLIALADCGKGGPSLSRAVREYEALGDLMGRIGSYASLRYAADTSDPARQKFFGDIQEKMTAIYSKIVFFEL